MSRAAEKIRRRRSRGDQTGALKLASRSLAEGDRDPLILMLNAQRLEEGGDWVHALALLREASSRAPDDPELYRRLGLLLARQGLHREGRVALEQAARRLPDQPEILDPLGATCLALGDLDAAEAHYMELARLSPRHAGPLAALAAIAVRRGDPERARGFAARALAAEPDNPVAGLALARLDLEAGDAGAAEARTTALLARSGETGEAAIGPLGLRADARDALGRYDAAFVDYVARNALVRSRVAPMIAGSGQERSVERARRLGRHFDTLTTFPPSPAPTRASGEPEAVMFVVGFPRSGTTLLEKALAGHTCVVTLPEIDCLGRAAGALLDPANLARLEQMTPAETTVLRRRYFDEVRPEAGELKGKVLVDKLPLHSIALPIIARLFPDATIILSLRDPRDVVLSCLRRRFLMNSAMFELLSPSDAANYYDAVMTLVRRYREILPIQVQEVRHERLVGDFQSETRRVLSRVDLEWEDTVADFGARAAARARTPSDLQLVHGLNSQGVGHWRGYAAAMSPILQPLSLWVQHWGYDPL